MRNFIPIISLFILFIGCKKKDETTEIIVERGIVSDVEGRSYSTVKIGDQWWMSENLSVRVFRDGSPIDSVTFEVNADTTWENSSSIPLLSRGYTQQGLLYNSAAVKDVRNIAPVGWHVATDEDWKKLETYIGMSSSEASYTGWRGTDEADKLSSQYNNGWGANNPDLQLYGIDLYGFNARPTGCKGIDGRVNIQNNSAYWWSVSETSELYFRNIDLYHKTIFRQTIHPAYGLTVRCVKD
jgi:uncharacterized protein (TIGR02145 family)